MRDYFLHILSNNAHVLYIGVTGNLNGRLFEHVRERNPSGFTARFNLDRLVLYETYPTVLEAIAREKQLKGWNREKKATDSRKQPDMADSAGQSKDWHDGNRGRGREFSVYKGRRN